MVDVSKMKRTREELKRIREKSSELASIISYFDSLRSALIHDPKEILIRTKTVGLNSTYFKYFSKETQKVLKKIGRYSRIRKMIRVNKVLRSITIIYFMITVALAILWQGNVALPRDFQWLYPTFLSAPSIILLLVLANITLLMLSLTKYEIKRVTEEGGIKEEEATKKKLKEAVQHHIDRLREYIEKYDLNPEDYKIRLHMTDYDGIKVIKKPGLLRGYYLAIIDTKKRER